MSTCRLKLARLAAKIRELFLQPALTDLSYQNYFQIRPELFPTASHLQANYFLKKSYISGWYVEGSS